MGRAVSADNAAAAAELPPFISVSCPRQLHSHREQPEPSLSACKDAISAAKLRCQQRSHPPAAPFCPAPSSHAAEQTPRGIGRGWWLTAATRLRVSYLDGLVRSTVKIILGSHQSSHPVVETCQLLLQLQLSAYNVPDLWEAQTDRGTWRGGSVGWHRLAPASGARCCSLCPASLMLFRAPAALVQLGEEWLTGYI